MPPFSTLLATVLLLLALLRLYAAHLGGAETNEQLSSLIWALCVLGSSVAGWLYGCFRKRLWGIIHSMFMFVVAFVCGLVSCGDFFGKQSVGGHGPGANPAGPVLTLVTVVVAAVGVVALICAFGVLLSLPADRSKRLN